MSTYENHGDAAIAAIKAIEDFGLSPPEMMMVLSTASSIVENEITAASTAIALKNATMS